MKIIYTTEDIFKVKEYSIIVHACNCKGYWGAGIARQIKQRYYRHFQLYSEFCRQCNEKETLGGSLLISPSSTMDNNSNKHFIACLFTNLTNYVTNPSKEEIEQIINSTNLSLNSLLCQVQEYRNSGIQVETIHMPKINSGYFGIPWNLTEECIMSINLPEDIADIAIHIHTI